MTENGTHKWLVLATVMVGTALGRLDQTIVNLALPKIISDFGITVSAAGWIATAYILANAVFVPIWGKLGDTIGRKKVYILGFLIFILGSILAGLSWNLGSMIIFRIIQAIAGSADYPTAMAILAVTFTEGKERAQAMGIWSASFAASAILGPLIGGPLIDSFGWRSVFLINLPVGLIGLAMAWLYVHESVSEKKTQSFDWWGAILLGGSLSSLVLVLDRGLEWGWFSINSILCYTSMIVFFVIFYIVERNHKEPIIDFKFFKIPAFINALGNNFVIFLCLMGSVFLIPIFAQTFLGYTATQTGYLFIPMAIGMMGASAIGGSLTGRVPSKILIFTSTIGAAFGIFLFSYLDPRSTAIDIMIPLFVMSSSLGLAMAQRTAIVAALVPQHEIGVASAILALVRNIAGAFGIAIFGTILNNATESHVLSIAAHSTINSMHLADMQTAIGLIELKAQVSAYATVYEVAALVLVVGAFFALLSNVNDEKMIGVKIHAEA